MSGLSSVGKSTRAPFHLIFAPARQLLASVIDLRAFYSNPYVTDRILYVAAESFLPEHQGGSVEGAIPLTTSSKFNRHGELVERFYPAGDKSEWRYDEKNEDRRAHGNLLQFTRTAARGVPTDQEKITIAHTYESRFQRRKSTTGPRGHTVRFAYDDRGNLKEKIYPEVTILEVDADQDGKRRTVSLVEKFDYNAAGQVIRVTDSQGAVTEYFYYESGDPTGAKGRGGIQGDHEEPGGYLARIVRDPERNDRILKTKPAHLVTELGYDAYGNITTVWDGKGNPTFFKYNARNRLIRATSRVPFKYEVV